MSSHASPAALSRAALPLMGHSVGVAGPRDSGKRGPQGCYLVLYMQSFRVCMASWSDAAVYRAAKRTPLAAIRKAARRKAAAQWKARSVTPDSASTRKERREYVRAGTLALAVLVPNYVYLCGSLRENLIWEVPKSVQMPLAHAALNHLGACRSVRPV